MKGLRRPHRKERTSPALSKAVVRAPPIRFGDKLRLLGGNFLGSGPSAPDLGGADWPSQANTF